LSEDAREALRQLDDEQWGRLIKELGRYALSVSRNKRWRTKNPFELPGGETTQSIVSKVIKMVLKGALDKEVDESRTLPGVRRWNPQKDPDLKKYLMNAIKSVLNHLAVSAENTMFEAFPNEGAEGTSNWELASRKKSPETEWLARPTVNPQEELLAKEEAAFNDHALQMLMQAASDDNDTGLLKVINAMRDGHGKPAGIAKAAQLSVEDVYNAMKRLDRKAAIVRKQIQKTATMNQTPKAKLAMERRDRK
jgi:hypothetical protein